MNAVAGLLRGRSIILKITRARNSIKFSKIHSSGRDWLRAAAAWRGPARDHTSGGEPGGALRDTTLGIFTPVWVPMAFYTK